MDLSSYDRVQSWIMGAKKLQSFTKGEVVMDMEKTKIVTKVEAADRFAARECNKDLTKYYLDPPKLDVLYQENEFLHAQMDIHSAQQLKFPSHALMGRPSAAEKIIKHIFPTGGCYSHDLVYATTDVLESDGQQDPIIMAANTTSAALMVSGILWGGPIGFVRIGRIKGSEDGAFVINPTMDQIIFQGLDLNLVYACSRDKTLMIELEGCEVSNRDVEAALRLAHHEAVKYIEPQIRLAERAGTQKKDYKLYMTTDESRRIIENKVKRLAEPRFNEVIRSRSNTHRIYKLCVKKDIRDEIKQQAEEAVLGEECNPDIIEISLRKKIVSKAVDAVKRNVLWNKIIEEGVRFDGRRFDQVRVPQYCESGALPVRYGSSVFWIGDTQVLCHVVLQNLSSKHYSSDDEDDDELGVSTAAVHERYQPRPRFHFSPNTDSDESAKKAFLAVLPPEDDFPYYIGALAKVIDSGLDGSSTTYMACVCGASLALMDAGIPLKRHVAGVSMGLVSDVDPSTGKIKNYRVLTDISGHDLAGVDMKLNIAGTRKGVTAIRSYIRKPSVAAIGIGTPLDIICECLEPASKAHLQVLEHMEREIDAPRRSTPNFIQNGWNWRTLNDGCFSSEYIEEVYCMDSLRNLKLIGPAAADDPTVPMSIKEKLQAKFVSRHIVGQMLEGVVCLIREAHGVFVEIDPPVNFVEHISEEIDFIPNIGFLHISEMLHNEDDEQKKISVGQHLTVVCIGYDTRGFLKLSLKKTIPAPK